MEEDYEDSFTIRGRFGLLKWEESLAARRLPMLDGIQTKEEKPSETQVGGDHYQQMGIQPSEFIHRNGIGWCEGNAIKYICRHSKKAGPNDIDKAIHYLQLLKEWHYGEEETKQQILVDLEQDPV